MSKTRASTSEEIVNECDKAITAIDFKTMMVRIEYAMTDLNYEQQKCLMMCIECYAAGNIEFEDLPTLEASND